jgi:hypothetical protein
VCSQKDAQDGALGSLSERSDKRQVLSAKSEEVRGVLEMEGFKRK